jgi:hypothetical protein
MHPQSHYCHRECGVKEPQYASRIKQPHGISRIFSISKSNAFFFQDSKKRPGRLESISNLITRMGLERSDAGQVSEQI